MALYFALAAQLAFGWPYTRKVERMLHAADAPTRDLAALSQAIELLERGQVSSGRLVLLQQQLHQTGPQASTAIARLRRILEMHDWQHNMIFGPIAAVLMWSVHLGWALESWRRTHGAHVRVWLRIIGEFEALASLSAYAFEHPADPFPTFTDDSQSGARFEGTGLGHPLVPAARMQVNDVSLTPERQLLVVSGSNMSGKSTLLRTVGITAVMAQAGAPVRAASLRMSALAVGATLRIQDSLQEGRSRFYAEITRIRELADLARGPVPLLFLLDELFHGTNSHDRLVGASGVLRQPDRARLDWPGDDARPVARRHRGRARRPCGQRPLRGLVRRSRHALRLSCQARARHEEQRAGADAGGRAGCREGLGLRPE